MFSKFKKVFRVKSEYERMDEFLSQAKDRYHLEYLEREWDRMKRKKTEL